MNILLDPLGYFEVIRVSADKVPWGDGNGVRITARGRCCEIGEADLFGAAGADTSEALARFEEAFKTWRLMRQTDVEQSL